MGQEKLGMVEPSTIKAVGLFGGGVAHTGGTCGALLGAVAALSCIHSRGSLEETQSPHRWEVSGRFVRSFENLTKDFGGSRCADIARVDWSDPQAVSGFHSGPESRKRICAQLVGDTAHALGELMEQETSGLRGHDVK